MLNSLSDDGAVKYSPGEKKIFTLLPAKQKTTSDIAIDYYGKGKVPYHGRQIVVGLLSSLQRKVRLNREPFRIMKTKRSGPIPMSFWVEKCRP